MVVVVKEKDGKIEITKEELEAIIEEAKAEGRKEAPIVYPYPYYPNPIPYFIGVTCDSSSSC